MSTKPTSEFSTLWCATTGEWRGWLQNNHTTQKEVWLEFYRAPIRKKRPENQRGPSYDESLDQALCFGWIDVSVRKIDEERYAQRFVPRKDPLKWTPGNIEKLKTLHKAGLVSPAGLAAIAPKLLSSDQ